MFSLNDTPIRPASSTTRQDAPNLIFGGSGGAISRNNCGTGGDIASTAATFNPTTGACDPAATGHAHDSDAIVANNGDIVRVVSVNHADGSRFQTFNYDNYSPNERIVPRAITLLDYTPGGPDLLGLTGPVVPGDIGATGVAGGQAQGSEIHGENGDDFIYGGPGNDLLFGDGQNDTMIGGYGNDWMSGGTGDDGLLGADELVYRQLQRGRDSAQRRLRDRERLRASVQPRQRARLQPGDNEVRTVRCQRPAAQDPAQRRWDPFEERHGLQLAAELRRDRRSARRAVVHGVVCGAAHRRQRHDVRRPRP